MLDPCLHLYTQLLDPARHPSQFLVTLHLNRCCIGEAGGLAIAAALKAGNLVLRVLSLSNNSIGDKAAAAFGEVGRWVSRCHAHLGAALVPAKCGRTCKLLLFRWQKMLQGVACNIECSVHRAGSVCAARPGAVSVPHARGVDQLLASSTLYGVC